MRFDSTGLWWEDLPRERANKTTRIRPTPPIPDTGWKVPTEFPDLSSAALLSVDVETKDEGLSNGEGPGTKRDDSYLVGIAIGTGDGFRGYYPIRHERGGNLDPDTVIRWARDQLTRPNQPKVGANIMYDLEWLDATGIQVEGPFHDVQYSGPLLDEYAYSYALETLSQKYLNEGKDDGLLYQWLSDAFGGNATRRAQGGNIWRAPIEIVGPYAESDVDLPIKLYYEHKKLMDKYGLSEIYEIEHRLIPMLLQMRKNGVRMDIDKVEKTSERILQQLKEAQAKLNKLAGRQIDVWASQGFAPAFRKAGIDFPKTPKGNPSFRKDWLENHPAELPQLITQIRKWEKFQGTFLRNYILNKHVNGRLFCQFHPLRTDDGGTVSGRFSSSHPNLQNIPARDPELGPLIRSMFLPNEGEDWYKGDYSQIEPRLLLHYAPGAESVRERYQQDPTINCYNAIGEEMPKDISYTMIKGIYLGMTYGMGIPKLAKQLGITKEQASRYWDMFHQGAPYVGDFKNKVTKRASQVGYIRTLLGRRARFPFWEERKYRIDEEKEKICKQKGDPNWFTPLLDKEKAIQKWNTVKRAATHKSVNRLIQGGSADILKKAMRDSWEAGIYNNIMLLLTVHDELDNSVPRTKEAEEAVREQKNIMEKCVSLRVPLLVDLECGPSWGEVKKCS